MPTRAAALLGNPQRPTWSWDFARTGRLPPGATFTRASTAWYFNSAGVLVPAANDVPRFDHDPLTGQPLGYLAEMASTNFVTYSSDGSAWNLTNVTQTTDGTLGPDGATLAVKITATAGLANHLAQRGTTGQGVGNPIVMSAFVKRGSTRYVVLVYGGDSPWRSGTFDLDAGTWLQPGTNATLLPPRQLANGWWRLAAAWTPINNVLGVGIAPSNDNDAHVDAISYNAAGTETVYTTGWQVDTTGAGLTSYIPTSGNAVTRAKDILSIPVWAIGFNGATCGVLSATHRLHTIRPSGVQAAAGIGDVGGNDYVALSLQYGGAQRVFMRSGGVTQFSPSDGSSPSPFARRKAVAGWSTVRGQLYCDGVPTTTIAGVYALPVDPTNLHVGDDGYNDTLNGTVESVAYWRSPRSDVFVQRASR